jgi:hypothetical protein
MKSLNKVILLVAALVSIIMVVGVYMLFSGFGDRMMQKAAFSQSSIVAKLTFSNMFQLMNQGWKRDQVIAFTESATKSLSGSPLQIGFYRGDLVNQKYGEILQPPMSPELEKAMRTGKPLEIAMPQGGRYIYPLVADQRCLSCHENVKVGNVMGAITVDSSYDKFIDDTRQLLMLILLMLAPMPFIAAWLVTIYLDSRINRFIRQVDSAIGKAETSNTVPNFDPVKPSWSELDEILNCFKRLGARIKG